MNNNNSNLNLKKVLSKLKKARPVPPVFKNLSEVMAYVNDYMYVEYSVTSCEINCGRCFIWAYLVWCLSPEREAITFLTTSGHVVVKYKGKFYDSEHLKGAKSAKSFCAFDRPAKKHVNCITMLWYWARQGYCKDDLRKLVKAFDKLAYEAINPITFDDYFDGWECISELEEVSA